jgi:hypothetical protein
MSKKIIPGFKLVYEKLVKESALHGRNLVFGDKWQIRSCSCRGIIEKLRKTKVVFNQSQLIRRVFFRILLTH